MSLTDWRRFDRTPLLPSAEVHKGQGFRAKDIRVLDVQGSSGAGASTSRKRHAAGPPSAPDFARLVTPIVPTVLDPNWVQLEGSLGEVAKKLASLAASRGASETMFTDKLNALRSQHIRTPLLCNIRHVQETLRWQVSLKATSGPQAIVWEDRPVIKEEESGSRRSSDRCARAPASAC